MRGIGIAIALALMPAVGPTGTAQGASVVEPAAAALVDCGVRVAGASLPNGVGGLWLGGRRLILIGTDLGPAEADLALRHQTVHALRACARGEPDGPVDRGAWIAAMLDEEADAVLAEADRAAELEAGDLKDLAIALARRPAVAHALELRTAGAAPETVRGSVRRLIDGDPHRASFEALLSLSTAADH